MFQTNKSLFFTKLKGSEKKDLSNSLRKNVAPDDVIAGILSFLTTETIPLDTAKIHTAVFKLKNKEPELFEDFIFTTEECYPHSALLERVIFRLQNADLISTVNPDFKQFIVTKASKKHIKTSILPLFSHEKQEKLKELSGDFQATILASP